MLNLFRFSDFTELYVAIEIGLYYLLSFLSERTVWRIVSEDS